MHIPGYGVSYSALSQQMQDQNPKSFFPELGALTLAELNTLVEFELLGEIRTRKEFNLHSYWNKIYAEQN